MDFLRQKISGFTGSNTPFTIGERIHTEIPTIWTVHHGTMKNDGTKCTIFTFDGTSPSARNRLILAQNMVKRLKRLRIPGVLKILESVESDTSIMVATEHVVPLTALLHDDSDGTLGPEAKTWGLHSVFQTLRYLESQGSHVHGNVNVGSIYVTDAGEWVVGGLEVATQVGGNSGGSTNNNDNEDILFTYGDMLPSQTKYSPPEVSRSGWQSCRRSPYKVDSWQAGVLVYEVFNGLLPDSSSSGSAVATGQKGQIPTPSLWNLVKALTNQNPALRPQLTKVLDDAKFSSALKSDMCDISESLKSLTISSDYQFSDFLDKVGSAADKFPSNYIQSKLLPEIVKCMDLNKGGVKALTTIIRFGKNLDAKEFQKTISPVIVKMFQSPDRAVRMQLLLMISDYMSLMDEKVVRQKIFDTWSTGFADTEPAIREETLKSVVHMIDKLTNRQVNVDLLRLLAKTQNDQMPDIRANTTILLGRIAEKFDSSSRGSVLIAAFTKALKDPHVPSRLASLMALRATEGVFMPLEVSGKLMGPLCSSLLDKDQSVREQASSTVDLFLGKIKARAQEMDADGTGASADANSRGNSSEWQWPKVQFGGSGADSKANGISRVPSAPISVSTTPSNGSFESHRAGSVSAFEPDRKVSVGTGFGQTKGFSLKKQATYDEDDQDGNEDFGEDIWNVDTTSTKSNTAAGPIKQNSFSTRIQQDKGFNRAVANSDEGEDDADWSW